MRLALVLTVAWCVLPVRAQSPPPPPVPLAVRLLDGYATGVFPAIQATSLKQFRTDLQSTAGAWILAGSPADADRRRHAAALAALDAAVGAPVDDWLPARELVDWGRELLGSGPPSAFERDWLLASIALAEQHLDENFLGGEHLKYAQRRFPADPVFARARVFTLSEVNRLSRRPFASPYHLLRGQVSSSPLPGTLMAANYEVANARIRDTAAQLGRLTGDADLGELARLRLGILHYEVGELDDARRLLGSVADSSTDPATRYLAHLVTGLANATQSRMSAATEAFQRAVAIDPAIPSGAFELSAHYQSLGRPDEASAILDAVFGTKPTIDDPWQFPCAHCASWTRRLSSLHVMVRQ